MQFAAFLKPLLHGSTPEAADGFPPESDAPPDSKLNREMPVEVMNDFDTVLLFGRLVEESPEYLKIERVHDEACFPILEEGSIVLVRGYDARMDPVILQAIVVRSSGLGCTVEHLRRINYHTDRKGIRYPVCPPGAILASDGRHLERPQPCQLLNISTGGVCIVSDQLYTVGQSLRVCIGPAEDGAAYPCQVVRSTPRRGGFFEYGLRFVHLGREQREQLARTIQNIQEETGKKLLPDHKTTPY